MEPTGVTTTYVHNKKIFKMLCLKFFQALTIVSLAMADHFEFDIPETSRSTIATPAGPGIQMNRKIYPLYFTYNDYNPGSGRYEHEVSHLMAEKLLQPWDDIVVLDVAPGKPYNAFGPSTSLKMVQSSEDDAGSLDYYTVKRTKMVMLNPSMLPGEYLYRGATGNRLDYLVSRLFDTTRSAHLEKKLHPEVLYAIVVELENETTSETKSIMVQNYLFASMRDPSHTHFITAKFSTGIPHMESIRENARLTVADPLYRPMSYAQDPLDDENEYHLLRIIEDGDSEARNRWWGRFRSAVPSYRPRTFDRGTRPSTPSSSSGYSFASPTDDGDD